MIRPFLLLTPLWIATGFAAPQEKAGTPADPELVRQVSELLIARCAECHGLDSEEPKATKGWPDAHDLAGTIAHKQLVVPGDPGASDLYLSVLYDDMPPEDSDFEWLNETEKALISKWIEAGAPLPQAAVDLSDTEGLEEEITAATDPETDDAATGPDTPEGDGDAGAAAQGVDSAQAEAPNAKRDAVGWMTAPWPKFFGRFHPTLVHFPIALLTIAALAEVLGRVRREPFFFQTAWFCLAIGALASIPAAVMGWVLAESGRHNADDLFWHRWLGVAVTVLACATLAFGRRFPKYRFALLLAIAALVGITGHYGGYLSYGRDWLSLPG